MDEWMEEMGTHLCVLPLTDDTFLAATLHEGV
jgi:hypothetical protein